MKTALPDIATLIPHRPPMRFVNAITRFEGDHATVTAEVTRDNPFARDDTLHPIVTLEHMAQSVAAWLELSPWGDGEVRTGFLIAVKRFELAVQTLTLPCALTINVENLWNDGTLGEFSCVVNTGTELVSRGNLTVLRHAKSHD